MSSEEPDSPKGRRSRGTPDDRWWEDDEVAPEPPRRAAAPDDEWDEDERDERETRDDRDRAPAREDDRDRPPVRRRPARVADADHDGPDEDWDRPAANDWADEPPARRGGIPLWVPVVAVLAALGLIFVLTHGGDDEPGSDQATTDDTEQTEKQCPNWPGIGGLGAPDITKQPGLHVWTDLNGWHASRVPGPDVPAVNVTVETNGTDGDNPTQKAVSGGAAIKAQGTRLDITIPDGDVAAKADFEIGRYANTVTITVKDEAGANLAPTAFTVGGGDQPTVNPVVATQEMRPCDT